MKIILEYDDLHPDPSVDCLEIAEQLLDKYPSLVLNFFVPPCYNGNPLALNKEWGKRLQKLTEDNRICIGVHGHLHSIEEFKHKDYPHAVSSIKAAEAILKSAGLPQAMAFRGPHWGLRAPTIEALIDLKYTHLYSHKDYDHLTDLYKDKIKIVHYNFNLADTWPKLENPMESDICVMHGHTHNVCNNGIGESYDKLCGILDSLESPTFLRIDEYV